MRISYLVALVVLTAFSVPIVTAQPQDGNLPSAATRPNIIFIITDDQRWDALGVTQRELGDRALFPWFRTPHLDRIAAEGARFRNAFVVHSLCSPSRAAFLTGQQTFRHKVKHNWQPLRPDLKTWAHRLHGAGYHTAYFGKWHMGQQRKRPGFATVFSYNGQGRYNDCVFFDNGKKVETSGWIDDVTTDRAIEFLKADHKKPFAIVIGYKTPHEPRTPPARRAEDFADVELTIPTSHQVVPPFRPEGYKPLPWHTRIHDRKNYFRCLAAIDDCVGRILETLDHQKLTQDTLLIFTSDNGYYLGEHASHDKRSAYEESIRIPLLVRYPRLVKAGTQIDAITLNIDIAPTILEIAKAKSLKVDGISLVPVLRDSQAAKSNDRSFLYENYRDPEFPKVTFDILALRTNTHKLITYPGHPEWSEAFDLHSDPLELKSVFANENFSTHRVRLVRMLQEMLEKAGLKPALKVD